MAEFTYEGVGATDDPDWPNTVPPGYRAETFERQVGAGQEQWDFARAETLTWGIQRRAGFTVRGTTPITVGDEVRLDFFGVRSPAGVIWVVDEPRRVGFGYGTLPGHPETGEEAFFVTRRENDEVWFTVRVFSRPSRGWRMLAPALRVMQKYFTRGYLRALVRP